MVEILKLETKSRARGVLRERGVAFFIYSFSWGHMQYVFFNLPMDRSNVITKRLRCQKAAALLCEKKVLICIGKKLLKG